MRAHTSPRGAGAAEDEAAHGAGTQPSAFARDSAAAAAALERLDPAGGPLVAYVGKLIVSKGVDLLLAAWPLVLERSARAQLAIVGFGAYRGALEQLLAALARGDLEGAREIALAGRALEGETGSRPVAQRDTKPLRHLLAFLDGLRGSELERYLEAAAQLPASVALTGRLEHDELTELLPACSALVVPSTFPESFGMVAAEAAACGVLPVSAAHSGLAEVSAALALAVPREAAGLLSFPVDDRAVTAIAERLVGWLGAGAQLRESTRSGLVAAVRERWSWQSVAAGVIAAAEGRLGELASP